MASDDKDETRKLSDVRLPGVSGGSGGLAGGTLSLVDSVIMGIAGVAPGYTIAASTATLVAAVGLGSPAALLACGVAMFGIVFTFHFLGNRDADAGASYTWVGETLHPLLGYLAGWSLVAASVVFMVAGTIPAGALAVGVVSTRLADNIYLVGGVGMVVFVLMTVAVGAGVQLTARVQVFLSSIELAILVLFCVLMFAHSPRVHSFSWSWFGPGAFHGVSGFFAGALVAAFYYWGWDVTANLSEETKQRSRNPGLGGIIGVVTVFLLFEAYAVGVNLVMTSGAIHHHSADVLGVLGEILWPGLGGKLIVLAVILSTVATLETTIVQVTRTLFAMGRAGSLPKSLGVADRVRRTPLKATIVVGVVPLLLFVAAAFIGSVSEVLADAINAVGLQICIYYSLAGFSCVVAYRHEILHSWRLAVFAGLWPLLGAIFMVAILIVSIPTLNATTLSVGFGALGIGAIPLAVTRLRARAHY